MNFHENELVLAFLTAISVSFAFAMTVIFVLLSRVLSEARASARDEYKLFVYLNAADSVFQEFYSTRKNGREEEAGHIQ